MVMTTALFRYDPENPSLDHSGWIPAIDVDGDTVWSGAAPYQTDEAPALAIAQVKLNAFAIDVAGLEEDFRAALVNLLKEEL